MSCSGGRLSRRLTLIYVLVPTKVLAIELMSSPETPKSQILISPAVLTRMLEGLISAVVSPGQSAFKILIFRCRSGTGRAHLDE